MSRQSVVHFVGLLLGAAIGYNSASLTSGLSAHSTPNPGNGMLYDFRSLVNLNNWEESSDTVRVPGKSKAVFELQKARTFQRAIFFALLNPQPNGAGFAGYKTAEKWDLTGYHGLEMRARRQGAITHYKVVLRDQGLGPDESYSYEYIFEMPDNEFINVNLPFSDFKAYYRGELVPDAPPLEISDITSVGIQTFGGVYSDFKQSGPGTLEIDFLRAV
ncbi:uncharacterized protein LOC143035088 [Oratosquilla oratoria]|uniref:uncharacterized protein LOC143035088 n=1 Tax=Oratosquilla oratoria TaxID=337810 RepID=UPI003F778099